MTDTFETLVKGCREYDLQSQEALYRQCYPEMIRICYRYAGDMDGAGTIFNNAMLRVYNNIHQYREEGKFMGWIRTIIVNCCLDYVRKQARFKEQKSIDGNEETISIPPDVWNRISAKDIHRMVQQLPKSTAAVFNLFIYEGFTHKEIARSLGISEGTSKWHVNEGRRLLKTKLEILFKQA